MSETSSNWPFIEVADDGIDIASIFGNSATNPHANPFETPQQTQTAQPAPQPAPAVPENSKPEPVSNSPASAPKPEPEPAHNFIEVAFEQKTVENAKTGLLDKPPVFYHKGAKEVIEDPSMTFEELRIRKSEDFTDLEEGKYVSWSVEYCGIRKEVKDPKGTTIIAIKETIERSREFLDALKKAKDKNPDCFVKPKVVVKNKGVAAYKGQFRTLAEAQASDKVICLIPSADGRFYELRKTEQGEFIAPKDNVTEFGQIRAGFTPALPLIPMSLMSQITSFFRSFMQKSEYEALVLIYWDKQEKKFFAYVPKQEVQKAHVSADLRDCPYDDDERYIRYADIHSHNSMEAFFSPEDDRDECAPGLYMVMGKLDQFYPDLQARIFCGGSFVEIEPETVVEGLTAEFPVEWSENVSYVKKARSVLSPRSPDTFLDESFGKGLRGLV